MSYALDVALHDALAGLVAGRVHPAFMPERPVYPCIRYMVASSEPDATLCGQTTLTLWRYRFDVYAPTHGDAVQLSESIKAIMRRFAWRNRPLMDIDGYEPEVRVIRRTLDFSIWERIGVDVDYTPRPTPYPHVSHPRVTPPNDRSTQP
jgi:hypothetical protein